MGSTGSHIRDMEEMYSFYCKELGEKERDISHVHYDWIKKFYNKETTLTFEEFAKLEEKKNLEIDLLHLGLKIKELQKKEAELITKLAEL